MACVWQAGSVLLSEWVAGEQHLLSPDQHLCAGGRQLDMASLLPVGLDKVSGSHYSQGDVKVTRSAPGIQVARS